MRFRKPAGLDLSSSRCYRDRSLKGSGCFPATAIRRQLSAAGRRVNRERGREKQADPISPTSSHMKGSTVADTLAIKGGRKACRTPWPERGLFGAAEKRAVMALFDRCARTGKAFGYNGPEEQAYCREFASFLGGGYADAVNSGTSAVYVALKALQVKAFSEVICGPVSDPGGIMPVALAGCIPIIADSEPGSYNVSPRSIAKRINKRTGAVIATHIAGIPADMGPIMEAAKSKNIPVIEDCAQAHGARYRGRYVGTFVDVGAFSTMHGKHHATGGQGGVVFTKKEDVYWRARRFSDRGKPFNLDGANGNVVCSHNLNLNDLSACIGRVQLKKLPRMIEARRRSAKALIEGCKKDLKAFRVVEGPPRSEPSYWFLFVRIDPGKLAVDKETVVETLAAEGVRCETGYLHLFTRQDWYRDRKVFEGTEYPWTCPLYKGNPDRSYPVPNVAATDACTMRIFWHERVTVSKAREVLHALKKIEAAYAR